MQGSGTGVRMARIAELWTRRAMDALRADTGALVPHANTYADVGGHVGCAVDPPCDRDSPALSSLPAVQLHLNILHFLS